MRLIKAYEAWARDIGVMAISLGVSTGVHHDRTIALYEMMGFEEPSVALQKRLS
jgi:GNAT superfamily N-acetyltransferase